jgi:hypothetical protein
MNIGYGSVSSYDSIRYDLFFDSEKSSAFFKCFGKTYNIKLPENYIGIINANKKIWITLTQLAPSKITNTTIFEPSIRIMS